MAFSENLADRLRVVLATQEDLVEKKLRNSLVLNTNFTN